MVKLVQGFIRLIQLDHFQGYRDGGLRIDDFEVEESLVP